MKTNIIAAVAIAMLLPLFAAAATPEKLTIAHGPYLQAVGPDRFTVCWETNIPSVGWIEIAPDDSTHFYRTERPQHFDARFGRKRVGKFHSVTISGLKPATAYRYRVMQQSVLSEEGRARVLYGEGYGSDILKHKPFKVSTLDSTKPSVKFAVVNDMHEQDSLLRRAFAGARDKGYDFVMFNGDMTTEMTSSDYIWDNYLHSASELFASDIPLYMARGNHENRGDFAINYMDMFPSLTGAPYYGFRQGPVYFLVLDGGEDKPDSDIRNLGIMCQDQYRDEELAWLRTTLASPEFREAPVKIAFIHMPPDATPKGWYGVSQINEKFMPLLNDAGISLMLCGHYHKYKWIPAGTKGYNNTFPIILHDDKVLLEAEADRNKITLTTFDKNQKPLHRHTVPTARHN